MLKSLTVILACFLSNLGPPDLVIPGSQENAPRPTPEAVQESSPLEVMRVVTVLPAEVKPSHHQKTRLDPKSKASLENLINKYSKRHGVNRTLVRAVLKRESGGNPRAVSPKGAMGLMQLMPDTAALLGVQDPFDPEENLAGGVRYLKYCLNRFQQDQVLALAAYNAGPEAVKKYGGVPPYRETQEFIANILGDKVASLIQAKRTRGATKNLSQEPKPESPPEEGLAWNLPQPTWKIKNSVVKVSGPKWKISPAATRLSSLRSK